MIAERDRASGERRRLFGVRGDAEPLRALLARESVRPHRRHVYHDGRREPFVSVRSSVATRPRYSDARCAQLATITIRRVT